MAYTKTPVQDTHSLFRIPPTGNQSFTSNTRTFEYSAGLRYVNCYPTIRESKTKEQTVTLVKVPKLTYTTWYFPDATTPGITDYDYETNLFVHLSQIFKAVAPTPTISLLYTATGYQLLSCQKVIDYSGNGEVIITGICKADSDQYIYSYTYNETTNTFAVGANALAGAANTGLETYALVRDIFIDGYHVVATKSSYGGTNRVFISHPGDYNNFSTSTDYFVPEIDPDNIVDIQKHRNFLCIIGTHTIEFFYNAGLELGSPFVRQENYTIRLGAAQNITYNQGLASIQFGDDIYFFATSENGGNAIYVIRNFQAIKISDDYIDYVLNSEAGLVSSIVPSSARLGLVDIMGNIQLTLEFRDPTTDLVAAVFVFNEKDMVWWEWKQSDLTGFIDSSVGIGSNMNGHPFMLDGQTLGVGTNAQYSVVLPQSTPYYTYDDILFFRMNAALQKSATKTLSINGALLQAKTATMSVDANITTP